MPDAKQQIAGLLMQQREPGILNERKSWSLSDLATYLSPSNQDWAPWPVRAVRGTLAALAAPGDAYAGRLPMMDSSGHTSLEAIGRGADLAGLMTLGAIGAPRAPRGALGSGFVRRTRGDSPDNGTGHMMFVKESKLDDIGSYGRNLWHFDTDNLPAGTVARADDSAFRRGAYRALRSEYDAPTARALVDEANPKKIVDSAGLWDDPASVEILWNNYLDRKGILAVETSDGAVLFDPQYVRRAK